MATFRNARKTGKKPVKQIVVTADNLKFEPEVVEDKTQPVVTSKKKRSEKTSTQDNQFLGGK